MYRYARTRNRVHRVYVEGGRAFKVENCNLDDVGFLHLDDVLPEGQKCAYCWAGWADTPTSTAAEDVAKEPEKPDIPPNAKEIPLVTSTRRMAAIVLAGAILTGVMAGWLVSVDDTSAAPLDGLQDELRGRLEELAIQIRILSVDVNGHSHEQIGPNEPVIVIIPTAAPEETFGPPIILPEPDPTPVPSSVGKKDDPVNITETTIIVVQPTARTVEPVPVPTPVPSPTPKPEPTPEPTPVCPRPGQAVGAGDPCRWPGN